jgi:F0F1-type ATP synthase assembly protein I
MTEDDLSSKMHDFLTVLDQVKKYRSILSSLTDFAIILAATFVAVMFVYIFVYLSIFFNLNSPIPLTFLLIGLPILGVISGVFWVNRKVRSVKVGQWKTALGEGAPGAIRILQELNWDNVYAEIRYAKLGFLLYGLAKTAAFWFLAFVVTWFAGGFLVSAIHWSFNLAIAALFSLVLVLVLEKNDFQKRYEQIGRLDSLLWELRWFDNDFRRSDFQA